MNFPEIVNVEFFLDDNTDSAVKALILKVPRRFDFGFKMTQLDATSRRR